MLWSFKLENWIAIGSSIEFHLYKKFYLVSILLNISVVLSLIGVHCWIFCTTCFTKYFLWYFLTYVIIRRENLIISFHCKCYVVKYVTLAKCSKFEINISSISPNEIIVPKKNYNGKIYVLLKSYSNYIQSVWTKLLIKQKLVRFAALKYTRFLVMKFYLPWLMICRIISALCTEGSRIFNSWTVMILCRIATKFYTIFLQALSFLFYCLIIHNCRDFLVINKRKMLNLLLFLFVIKSEESIMLNCCREFLLAGTKFR